MLVPAKGLFAAELRFECPAEIQTTQNIKEPAPEGWASIPNPQSKKYLDSISVFDGPPEELASLVPDNEENQILSKTVWSFHKKKDRPIWLACSYLRTDIVLAKALPLEITQCKVVLSKNKPHSIVGLTCK